MKKNSLVICFIAMAWIALGQTTQQHFEDYVIDRRIGPDNQEIIGIRVPGQPPDNYRAPVAAPTESSVTLPNVPAFTWCFGCSATSAAMMAGYYDNSGYPDLYTGPTNGGAMPMTNAAWGSVIINGETRQQCPLSATRNGIDGRTSPGHVDDYWYTYGSAGPDPYLTSGTTPHTWGDCTADFMGTNQSAFGNTDGSTIFYYDTDGSPLYDYTGCEPSQKDGCHGLRQFFESRGYTVIENYQQLIYGYDGNTLGFTFEQYKAEIDNGRPVLIQVTGHTMLGYGYDDASQTVYLHDTWDYNNHSMTWGGTYSGMEHYAVCCITLQTSAPVAQVTAVPLFSSVNVYTLLIPEQTCISYNPEIDALMFTARGHTGVLGTGNDVCTATSVDGGASFENGVTSGPPSQGNNRYPSGALYNPAGNTDPANAFKVITAPVTGGSGWTGNNFATNSWANNAPYNQFRQASTSGDLLLRGGLDVDANGYAHAAGVEYVPTNSYAQGFIFKGTFNAATGGYSFTDQTVAVPWRMNPTDNTYEFSAIANVAFSPDGSIGYAMFRGADSRAAADDLTGYQPIIFKTTNMGATWELMARLDLTNRPEMIGMGLMPNGMWERIWPLRRSWSLAEPIYKPWFSETDMVVDVNGNLHIMALCQGTYSDHTDSLRRTFGYEKGVLFDIYNVNQGDEWLVRYIDTLSTRDVPAEESGYGIGDDAQGWDHRLQASRSADGKVVFAIWSDTDSEFFGVEINLYPDIRGQAHRVTDGYSGPVVDFTNQGAIYGENYYHFVSPVCMNNGLNYTIPVTKSDIHTTYDPSLPVYHSYLQGIQFVLPEETLSPALTWYIPGDYVESSYPSSTLGNWDPAHSPQIKSLSSSPDQLEGYVYMATPLNEWKITTEPDWNGINYGAGEPGLLNPSGENLSSPAGYYKINVDAQTLAYTTNHTEWGVIGGATAMGWDDETPLQYSPEKRLWQGGMHLSADEFKFRANHNWDFNYGSNPGDEILTEGGMNIPVELESDYFITLDLSHPNAYTYSANRWGLLGDATPVGWTSDLDLIWDSLTNAFTITLALVPGEIKFRANDAWDLSLGGDPANLTIGGTNIPVTEPGNYSIALYLGGTSDSCSIVKNNSVTISSLIAGSGFKNCIPLNWSYNEGKEMASSPDELTQSGNPEHSPKSAPESYNIYRSEQENGVYELIGNTAGYYSFVPTTCFTDVNVTPGVTYYYAVTGIVSGYETTFSNTVAASSNTSGFEAAAQQTTNSPVIDGTIQPGEWADASLIDITNSLGFNNQPPALPVFAFAKRVGNYLYIAAADFADTTSNINDELGFYFDNNSNQAFDLTDGNLWIDLNPDNSVRIRYRQLNGTYPYDVNFQSIIENPEGVSAAIFMNNGHREYELSIDLTNSPVIPSGDAIGMYIFTYDGSIAGYNGYWPDGHVWANPATYGKLILTPPVSATPVTTAGQTGAAYNSPVKVPVQANGLTNVTAISLRLEYDPRVISYTGFSNQNSALSGIFINNIAINPTLNSIFISWSNINSVSLPDYTTLFDLDFNYLSGTTALVWNNASNNGSDCEYADAIGDPLQDVPTALFYHNGLVFWQPGHSISGTITYNNTSTTLLDNIKVVLMDGLLPVDSAISNTSGQYFLAGVQDGQYQLQASTTKPWSGINATDAVKIERHFAGLEPLNTPVKVDAADVNLSYAVNATDALKVKRRFASLDNSFLRGEWTFNTPEPGGNSLIISGADVTYNMAGLCVGDVNGSNFPAPGKNTEASVSLTTSGLMEVSATEPFSVPVMLPLNHSLGGISLVIDYPGSIVNIMGVDFPNPGAIIAIVDGQIRIAWSSVTPMITTADEPLFTIRMSAINTLSFDQTVALSAGIESEFADDQGEVVADIHLTAPEIKLKSTLHIPESRQPVVTIYPNPASDYLVVAVNTPTTLSIDLSDATGRKVIETGTTTEKEVKIDVSNLASGIYILKITPDDDRQGESFYYKILKN